MQSRIAIEEALAALWRETLNVPRVGTDDNFLDLGGNSLAAMRIASRLQDILGLEVPVSVILTDTTFGGLVDAICGCFGQQQAV